MHTENQDIYFIEVPPSLKRNIGDFEIDPQIPLPVEKSGKGEALPLEDLSWEMIVSGMLKALRKNPGGPQSNYYRRFILAVKPQIFQELTTSAIYKARNGNYSLSAEIFEILEALDPNNPRTLVNMALLLEDRAQQTQGESSNEATDLLMKRAEIYYQKALNLDTEMADTYLNAGFFYKNKGDFTQAAQLLQEYLRRGEDEKKLTEARNCLNTLEQDSERDDLYQAAKQAMTEGKPEEALSPIQDFLNLQPEDPHAWFLLGWAYRRLSRFSEADQSLGKALDYLQNSHSSGTRDMHIDILNERAICALEKENLENAGAYLQEALALQPDSIKIISNLGTLCLKKGDIDQARLYFQTVLVLEPEDQLAADILAQLDGAV